MNYVETDSAPKQIADGFADFLDREVTLMEKTHRQSHETGGYYVTTRVGGFESYVFPALSSGDRATSKPFTLGDWWRVM